MNMYEDIEREVIKLTDIETDVTIRSRSNQRGSIRSEICDIETDKAVRIK